MITVLSMSPAIDHRMEFETFLPGKTNRIAAQSREGAGKGVNVSLALAALAVPVRCIGLLPSGGAPIAQRLSRHAVAFDFLPAPGVVRTNRKLYDRAAETVTEISEASPQAPPALLARMMARALRAAKDSVFLVLTGSLPTACPPGWYAELIRRARREAPHCRCVLDADGERLLLGVQAGPFLIKPNEAELRQAAGKPLRALEDLEAAARALLRMGAETVVVSLGERGAFAADANTSLRLPALPVSVKTTTGAGDAMVAGLLAAFSAGEGLAGALRRGLETAAARCQNPCDAFFEAPSVHAPI